MLKNAALVAKIGVDTAENEPQKEPSTRLFLPTRAGGRLCLRKPVAGLCAALVQVGRGRGKEPRGKDGGALSPLCAPDIHPNVSNRSQKCS